jgi:hypothetical protein
MFGFLGVVVIAACPTPASIREVVDCRNTLTGGAPVAISSVLAEFAPEASVACTTSRASAQPAAPELGDLRCFQVLPNGLTLSFNLLEGLNGDRIEVSQPSIAWNRDEVFLANVSTQKASDLGRALADAVGPFEPGSNRTCGMCHKTVGLGQVDGVEARIFAGIRLNSTIRGTVPRNGQIAPEELRERLKELLSRHGCPPPEGYFVERRSLEGSETCRRISVVSNSAQLFPLDSP